MEVVCDSCEGKGWRVEYVNVLERGLNPLKIGTVYGKRVVTDVKCTQQRVCVPCSRCGGDGKIEVTPVEQPATEAERRVKAGIDPSCSFTAGELGCGSPVMTDRHGYYEQYCAHHLVMELRKLLQRHEDSDACEPCEPG